MKCLISGMLCSHEVAKDKQGNDYHVAYLFSEGDTVRIPNIDLSDVPLGTFVDVLAIVKLSEFEGRRYLSIKPIDE